VLHSDHALFIGNIPNPVPNDPLGEDKAGYTYVNAEKVFHFSPAE
jgi:hypothetical protein